MATDIVRGYRVLGGGMDEQERRIAWARPGDVIRYDAEAAKAPAVGELIKISIRPPEWRGAPPRFARQPSLFGGWEVHGVEPIEGKPGHVTVAIRAL